jgi:RNA polymerase sigma-70 factor (ECF subfamily)
MIDGALLEQCKRGSEPAFRAMYYRTMPRVRAWVTRFVGPGAALADVVQEVYVQVYRSIATFRGDAAFSTWLYRITLNVATTHLRRASRTERGLDHDARLDARAGRDEEQRLQARDDLRRLYGALDALSDDKRAAFVLYELEGRSLQEIADITESPVPTVAARLRRARLELVAAFGANATPAAARIAEDS